MKRKIIILMLISFVVFSAAFAAVPFAFAAEGDGSLVISRDTDNIKYGKTVVYTAYYSPGAINQSAEYMWFVNDVKQSETSNTFTYTHKESGEVNVYAKYGSLTSNVLTGNIGYTFIELIIYYSLAAVALFGGIPVLAALSRNRRKSPVEAAYTDTVRLLKSVKKLEELFNSDRKVKDIRLLRLGFSIDAAADAALLQYEDTQIAVLQIAAEKFKEAYAYIHGIRIAMPKDESAEKISHSIRTLTELETLFKTIVPAAQEN